MEQIFLNESCKFYCRTTKGRKPVPVYANIKVMCKRFVIPTKTKVIPEQFNVRRQTAVISNLFPELDNINNRIVNDTLKSFLVKFDEMVLTLKNNPDKLADISEIIRSFAPMKKKEITKKFTDTLEYILNHELERQLKEHKITETWAVTKKSNIKKFVDYIKLKKLSDDWSVLSNKTFNDYKDYLLNECRTNKGDRLKISAINQALSTLKAITTAVNEREEHPFVETSRWKLADNRLTIEEQKSYNVVFGEDELQKIMDLKLEGTEAVIRDLFVFGCQVGQRPTDCVRILKGEGKRMVSNGIDIISILPHKTRKTNKNAFIPLFNIELVDSLMEKFENNEDYKDFINKKDTQRNSLNSKYIKSIFKKAGLNNEIEVTEQRGTEVVTVTKTQDETAHIYLSRHYFITLCFINHIPAETVIEITGHTTTKQVNDTYSHLSIEQKADRLTVNESLRKMVGKKSKKTIEFEKELFLKEEIDYGKLKDEEWKTLKSLE